ncbi:MAG: hypothetical protein WC959_03305 [Kiritimatiellales bacterium]
MLVGNNVPMFKLRPYRGLLIAAILVFILGSLLSGYFFYEDAYTAGIGRAPVALIVTIIITLLLLIAAFSRYGFKHLHHHRAGYKRG